MHPHAKLGLLAGVVVFLACTFITSHFAFFINAFTTCAIGWMAVKPNFIEENIFRTTLFTHISYTLCFAIIELPHLETLTRSQSHGLYVASFSAILIGLLRLTKP